MKPRIHFVIGACGVGKSSIVPLLQKMLPTEHYSVYDFDERGVPTNVDQVWRIEETRHWLEVGKENRQKNISTVICGCAMPDEIRRNTGGLETILYLLDADGETIRQRLEKRHADPIELARLERVTANTLEAFIAYSVSLAVTLREACQKERCDIMDTSDKTITEVAAAITKQIQGQ